MSFPAPLGSASEAVVVEGTEDARRGSLKVTASRSPGCANPGLEPPRFVSATGTGAAWSTGAIAPNDAWLPAGSATPPAAAARATVKPPTEVSAAPAPSLSETVAVEPPTDTEAIEPPEGTFARVH